MKPNNVLRSVFPNNMPGRSPVIERKLKRPKVIQIRQWFKGGRVRRVELGNTESITSIYEVRPR
jgi:hypothetical protein